MTPEKIRRAATLIDALEAIPGVHLGLKEKVEDNDGTCLMTLCIEAYEHQGESGGASHGESVLLPPDYAIRVLSFVDDLLRKELAALGAKVEP